MLVLIFILFLLVAGNYFMPFFIPDKEYDTGHWEKEIEQFQRTEYAIPGLNRGVSDAATGSALANRNTLREGGKIESSDGNALSAAVKSPQIADSFTGTFNPNNAEQNVLLQIGIPVKIVANWLKYLQKGGRFYKEEDVMKLYGMSSEIFDKLKGHLLIPGKFSNKTNNSFSGKDTSNLDRIKVIKETLKADINLADSAQLESLPGIGPALASRIIKYRKLLGGFYQINQLKEIYGMNEEWWSRICPGLTIGSIHLYQLDINYISLTEMGRHPYIGFRTAKRIIKMRDTAGKFRSPNDLALLFSEDSLHRIMPYLTIDTPND